MAGTSANSGARERRPLQPRRPGEIPFGNGDIRIIGGLLPQPTQQFDHEFGLAPYATTYTGYILARNLFEVPVTKKPDGTTEARSACAASSGFRRAAVRTLSKGRRLRFDFTPNTTRPVTVDVFQTSVGRRVLRERLVARFTNRRKAFTWNGRSNGKRRGVADGTLIVRYRMKLSGGKTDDRRFALRRSKGKLAKRPDYYGKATCNVLRAYKLERPAFGGRTNRRLNIAFRLRRSATVGITDYKGKKIVSRIKARSRKKNVTYRVRLGAKNLGRGLPRAAHDHREGQEGAQDVADVAAI